MPRSGSARPRGSDCFGECVQVQFGKGAGIIIASDLVGGRYCVSSCSGDAGT